MESIKALVMKLLGALGLGDRAGPLLDKVMAQFAGGADGQGGTGGGLTGMMKQFQEKGLGDVFGSWVGTGKNQPVSPDQVGAAFGEEKLNDLSAKTGLDLDVLKAKLAKYLPGFVDKLTPGGRLPGA